jgi:hypothetical protein
MEKNLFKTESEEQVLFKRIPKSLFSDPIWSNQNFTKKEAYLDLFSLAYDANEDMYATVDVRGYLIDIYPGEVAHGYRSLSERWGWSTKKVGRFLSDIETRGYISIRAKKPLTVMKLVQYVPRMSTKGNAEETKR